MKKNEKLLEIIGNIDERHLPDPREVFNIIENDVGQEAEMQLSSAYKRRFPLKAVALAASLIAAAAGFVIVLKNYPIPVDDPTEPIYTSETSKFDDVSEPTEVDRTAETTMKSESVACEFFPLDFIGYYIDDEGNYRFNADNWQESDDYDLFRKYFFGEWESDEGLIINKYPFYIMDDSEKAFIANEFIWHFGTFYKVSDSVFAYTLIADAESLLFWLDINEPGIMYRESYNGNYLFGYLFEDHKTGILTKTDTPVNQPENNYISAIRLLEISKHYGIDMAMLTDIRYYTDVLYENKEISIYLTHNRWYSSYPVYLVSEAQDKLELKTQIGNGYYPELEELDAEYTIEKIGAEWKRTVRVTLWDGSVVTLDDNSNKSYLSALELLDYYIDEEGHFQAGYYKWKASDDYSLFRKYFFGVWLGVWSDHYPYYGGDFGEKIDREYIIDDSEQSTDATNRNIWYSGNFFQAKDSVLVFIIGGVDGSTIYWIDTDDPDTLYSVRGGIGRYNFIISESDNGYPDVLRLTKTDKPINEPENGFLSAYRIYEMSRDHGIDIEMLTDIEYSEKPGYAHNAYACFYPIYLVSEAQDKIVLKTILWNHYFDEEDKIDAEYTIEKIDGKWKRTVELTLPEGETVTLSESESGLSAAPIFNKLAHGYKMNELPSLTVTPFCSYHTTEPIFTLLDITPDTNPWQETQIVSLPVFRNKYYGLDNTVQGGCADKDELFRMAETVTEILGLTIKKEETVIYTTFGTAVREADYTEDMTKYPIGVRVYCDGAKYGTKTISVYACDNLVRISFITNSNIESYVNDGYKLPDDMHWANGQYYTEENVSRNTDILNYLISVFKDLIQLDNPKVNIRTSKLRSSDGASEQFFLYVRDAGRSFFERLLNYNFTEVDFSFNGANDNRLDSITITDKLSLRGEYIGDYPIISAEEAKQILLSGKYSEQYLEGESQAAFENVTEENAGKRIIDEKYIRSVSLVYEKEPFYYDMIDHKEQRYFQPYYRFYVESEPYYNEESGKEDLIVQAYYYVPAVREDYISGIEN